MFNSKLLAVFALSLPFISASYGHSHSHSHSQLDFLAKTSNSEVKSCVSTEEDVGKIQEAAWVRYPSESLKKLILAQPNLTVDHMDDTGFEVYGNCGLLDWLNDIGAEFIVIDLAHGEKYFYELISGYPTYQENVEKMKKAVALNPNIAKMFSIGKSVEGRELWVVKISDNVEQDEVEPEFKYISSMHGNEITGRELTIKLIEDLISSYNYDHRITELINNTEIYIMPSMNPDGSKKRQRANANGYDLNRNFPDWVRGDRNTLGKRQPETKAVMEFQAKRQFSLSANFHGGSLVVNYPWDNTKERHPYDNMVQQISKKYSSQNPEMTRSRRFRDGITNGADWYVLAGGMQDWSYHYYNDLQVTVEVSNQKWPSYARIPHHYSINKESMINYIEAIHAGIGFKLKDSISDGYATLYEVYPKGKVVKKEKYGFRGGEFYKVLPVKGRFYFMVEANGKTYKTPTVRVNANLGNNGDYFILE